MKREIRLMGLDDAPFTFNDTSTPVIGAIMRGGEYLECVLRSRVAIDGTDATDVCVELINNTKHRQQLRAILLDGIALGGFNIVDIEEAHHATNLPIITITRDAPDFSSIKKALKQHFTDWEERLRLMQQGKLHRIKTSHNPVFIKHAGCSLEEAKEIITLSTIRGVVPEPIRVAHLIASGITRGESYGKA